MFAINYEVQIGNFRLPYCSEIIIDSRQDLLMDICTISFPNRLDARGKKIIDFIKSGDSVSVFLGYNGRKTLRFKGFVNKILPDRTAVIECLDEGYPYSFLLTEKSYNLTDTTFEKLFKEIAPKIPLNIADAKIGDWEILKDVSIFKVIEEFKQRFNIYPFFRNGVLTFGKSDVSGGILMDFQKNMPLDQDDLKLYLGGQSNYYIKGESKTKENGKTVINTVFFSKDGRTDKKPSGIFGGEIKIPGLTSAELTELCKLKYSTISKDGITGTATTFGEPFAQHGQIGKIKDNTRLDIAGDYFIKSVKTVMNIEGLRQTIGF
jgi:hypothetical protein